MTRVMATAIMTEFDHTRTIKLLPPLIQGGIFLNTSICRKSKSQITGQCCNDLFFSGGISALIWKYLPEKELD